MNTDKVKDYKFCEPCGKIYTQKAVDGHERCTLKAGSGGFSTIAACPSAEDKFKADELDVAVRVVTQSAPGKGGLRQPQWAVAYANKKKKKTMWALQSERPKNSTNIVPFPQRIDFRIGLELKADLIGLDEMRPTSACVFKFTGVCSHCGLGSGDEIELSLEKKFEGKCSTCGQEYAVVAQGISVFKRTLLKFQQVAKFHCQGFELKRFIESGEWSVSGDSGDLRAIPETKKWVIETAQHLSDVAPAVFKARFQLDPKMI